MTFEEFKKLNNKSRNKGKRVKIEEIENIYICIDNKKIIFEEFIEDIKNKEIFICNPSILKNFKKFKELIIGTFVYNKSYGIEISGIILQRLDEENYLVQYKDFYGEFWTEKTNVNELI